MIFVFLVRSYVYSVPLWSACPLYSLCLVRSLCPLCSLCLVRSVCPLCSLCLVRSVCPLYSLCLVTSVRPLCSCVWWDPCVLVFGEIHVSNVFLVFGEIRVSTVFLVHSGHTNLTKHKEYSGLTDLTKHREHSGHMDLTKHKEHSGHTDHKELHTHMNSQGTQRTFLLITQRTRFNTLYQLLLLINFKDTLYICHEPMSTAERTRVYLKRACAPPVRYERRLN